MEERQDFETVHVNKLLVALKRANKTAVSMCEVSFLANRNVIAQLFFFFVLIR